ncbi:MAG: hypothetical protein HUK01_10580 [Bacteroidaceae bacterium]|nr:hypothetical protein [Bacteroidaceae bacterium]
MTPTNHTYTRTDLANILSSLPRDDQQWSIEYLVSIVSAKPIQEEKPKKKRFQIKRSDIEAARKMMSFGEGCNVPADLDVRGILAEKYM